MKNKVVLGKFDSTKKLDRGRSKIIEIIWYMFKMIFFLSSFPFSYKLKSTILRCFGAKVGEGLVLKPRVNIHMPWKLSLGDNVWIGEGVCILNLESVKIGSNVCISQGAFLLTGNHDYNSISFDYRNAPVILEDGVWIGANSTVCPGIICRTHSVLSVGSIATRELESYKIYQGNPAKIARNREVV